MKKVLFLMVLSLFGLAFANDTYFYTSFGTLIPAQETDITVQMKSEVISIVLQPDYYEITVDFYFYNDGNRVDLSVGFPYFEAGYGGHGKIYDFRCWTNDELVEYRTMILNRKFSNDNYNGEKLENAFTRSISFPGKTTTHTKVNYKSEYGRDTEGRIIKYLYGTGSSWKNDIGEITFILENNLSYSKPDGFDLPDNSAIFERIADNKWETHFYHIEPEYTDCITIHTRNILDDTGPKAFPLYGWSFKDAKANEKWLFWYTKPQLRIIRNTIYALHGYNFKSEDLKQLFNDWGKNWYPKYEVNPNFSEADLSEIEKYNVKLILEEENKRSN